MCTWCDDSNRLLFSECLNPLSCAWGWDSSIKIARDEVDTYSMGVILDKRGYLRLVNLDDCECLDAGQKVKIKFCPFCGEKIGS